jgi:hypothetical protein
MAIICRNETSYVGWQQWLWVKLLRLAKASGWQPMGTTRPPENEADFPGGRWDSNNYTTNDGQIISAKDARGLADALEAAFSQISDDDVMAKFRQPDGGIEIAPDAPSAPDADWFSGSVNKANVAKFVEFCRQGAFRIY